MEKMVFPIPDSDSTDNTIYYRSVGKSLISDTDTNRIFIPTRENYETQLNIPAMSLPEQLVFHMIYDNRDKQDEVCRMLQFNENFQTDLYRVVEQVYNKTAAVLALTDPTRYCSRVNQNADRIYGTNDRNNVADQTYHSMPGFLKNLIDKCVAPLTLDVQEKRLELRNCATCQITEEGLISHVNLYNPVVPKYRSNYNESVVQVENVLKFRGDKVALQTGLARYEPYPLIVPLMLGAEVMVTNKNVRRTPLPQILPPRTIPPGSTIPTATPTPAPVIPMETAVPAT
jgi:hypothetical protein